MAGCDHFSQSPQNERFHLIFRDFSELLGPLTRNRASFISRCLAHKSFDNVGLGTRV